MSRIELYYKNVLDEVVGCDHGLSLADIQGYSDQVGQIVRDMNDQADNGKLPYR